MSANVRPRWLRRDRRLLAQSLSTALVGLIALCAAIAAVVLAAGGVL